MLIAKTYRYRLEPSALQRRRFAQFAGCRRFVFNRGLAARRAAYDEDGQALSYADQCKKLTAMKHSEETAWLGEVHSQVLQQALKDLQAAYEHFFRRVNLGEAPGFPKFKKKGRHDSFRYPQGVKVKKGKVYLPKIGWVKYRDSRPVVGRIRQATIKRESQHWFVCLACEVEQSEPVHPAASAIGVDLGIACFAACSDGTRFAPLNSFRKHEERLAHSQKQLSRKQKGSKNFRKLKAEAQRIHARIANARKDFLHKLSTTLCKNHAVIVIEDLNIKGMSASARGTVEEPGRNVRAKSGLNKSVLDQGWGMFRLMLEYKARWLGGRVIAVHPANTSRTCPECGAIDPENRKSQAAFKCVQCGHEAHADVNAACNILRAGLAQLACLAAKAAKSQAQGPNPQKGVLAGTNLACAMPGIPRL